MTPMRKRIAELEAELARLRERLNAAEREAREVAPTQRALSIAEGVIAELKGDKMLAYALKMREWREIQASVHRSHGITIRRRRQIPPSVLIKLARQGVGEAIIRTLRRCA
jgi:hypothetical protein